MPANFFTSMSRYVASVNDRYKVYLIGTSSTTFRYETPRFLIPNVDGIDVKNGPLQLPVAQVPETKGVAFIIDTEAQDAAARVAAIKAAYQGVREELHKDSRDLPQFYSILVEREMLLTASLGRATSPPPQLPEPADAQATASPIARSAGMAMVGPLDGFATLSAGFALMLLLRLVRLKGKVTKGESSGTRAVWTFAVVILAGYAIRAVVESPWSTLLLALGASFGTLAADRLKAPPKAE